MKQTNRMLAIAAVASIMLVAAVGPILVASTGAAVSSSLDRTGTRGGRNQNVDSQVHDDLELANRRSLKAERAGFEPAVSFWPTRHFQCRTFGRSVTSPAWAGSMDPAIIKRGASSVNRLRRRSIAVKRLLWSRGRHRIPFPRCRAALRHTPHSHPKERS
jgi:hypothetical protein